MDIRLPSRHLSHHDSLRLVRRYDLLRQRQLRLVERRLVTVPLVRVRVLLVVLHHLQRHRTHATGSVGGREPYHDRGRVSSYTHKVYPPVGDDLFGRVHGRSHRLREEVYYGGRLRLVPEDQHARRH